MKQFVAMCKEIGSMQDYVQGGGGNASCKINENTMAIKASGFTLKDITDDSGYVNVDYLKIKEYHTGVTAEEAQTREKESTAFTLSCVIPSNDGVSLRPSVETGFHSLLKKYVMHTHPVYANVLTCAVEGKEIASKIFKDTHFIWIPYINPGFSLTLAIKEELDEYQRINGAFPQIIFLENHGLVTTSDDADECKALHIDVNNAIKDYFSLNDFYTGIKLSGKEGKLVCTAPFVKDYCAKYDTDMITEIPLYPDQLVYLNNAVKDKKLAFENNEVVLSTNMQEGMAIIETLAAVVYIIDNLNNKGLSIKKLNSAETGFIKNWESEKYRKSVLK